MTRQLEPESEVLFIVESDLTSPNQVKDFLSRFGDRLKIEKRSYTCSSSVKIRYIGQIDEDGLVFEFATDEDKRFYRQAGQIGQDVEFVVVE